jgi:hypothetical protein
MIAREIFDQLLALLAALMGGAKPLNNPFEDTTKRKRSACSDCGARSSLCITRHEKTPTWSGSNLSLLVPCRHPIAALRADGLGVLRLAIAERPILIGDFQEVEENVLRPQPRTLAEPLDDATIERLFLFDGARVAHC